MVEHCIVRERFYFSTPAEGTPEQRGKFRRQKFQRALDWVEQEQLIGAEEINGVAHLRLTQPDGDER